jgi:hypothetical protein
MSDPPTLAWDRFPDLGALKVIGNTRTPGAINANVTQANVMQTVCVPGYTDRIRSPTLRDGETKEAADARARTARHCAGLSRGSLSAAVRSGASRDPHNLWP